MYLGKPEHLVKTTGVFTTAERCAVVQSIMQYRAEATQVHWEDDKPLSVEYQLQDGCRSSNESGHFSYVIDHPTDQDKIIKVQVKPSDAYPLFVNEVLRGAVRRYVPKFFATAQVLGHNVYIMERVRVLAEVHDESAIEQRELLRELQYMGTSEAQRTIELQPSWRKPIAFAYSYIRSALQELVICTDSFFDLHTYNWGVRKDGTIVCLDPIA